MRTLEWSKVARMVALVRGVYRSQTRAGAGKIIFAVREREEERDCERGGGGDDRGMHGLDVPDPMDRTDKSVFADSII